MTAAFSRSMQLLAGLKICTERPITNHPHYEDKALRQRTREVSLLSHKLLNSQIIFSSSFPFFPLKFLYETTYQYHHSKICDTYHTFADAHLVDCTALPDLWWPESGRDPPHPASVLSQLHHPRGQHLSGIVQRRLPTPGPHRRRQRRGGCVLLSSTEEDIICTERVLLFLFQ